MPDEVRLVTFQNTSYILYPSGPIASKVLYHLQGNIILDGNRYLIDFFQQAPKVALHL